MGRYTLNKYITRLMAVLLAMLLLVAAVPTAYAEGESGSCGGSLSWSLSAGTLTISGSGAMTDFPESTMAPWYSLREEITRVELPEGLTSIGDLAFYGCENLTAVVIPNSVERIGMYAFSGCTDLALLNLGSGVRTIEEAAFYDCVSLTALRLPDSLRTIGLKAFYRCESITTVTVPSGVTAIGDSAFSYCKRLVSATVNASVTTVPEWMFYGCERLTSVILPDITDEISDFAFRGCGSLNTVYYDGNNMTQSEIQELINVSVPEFNGTGFVTDGTPSNTVTSGATTDNGNGTFTQENITVTQSENASVSTTVESTHGEDGSTGGYGADISITVDAEKGWQEVQKTVEDALENFDAAVSAGGGSASKVEVNVYVKGTNTIDQKFVESMAGREVRVTVVTEDGSVWRMDGTAMDTADPSGEYNLSYTLSAGTGELNTELGTATSFILRFHAPAVVNAEVLIPLGSAYAYQNATLLRRDGKELLRFQTVVVDAEGCAHFYLASVDDDSDYYIAMNLPNTEGAAIVPEEILDTYGNPVRFTPVEYEITGRTSSWGMTINQVTWIMVGFLAVVVIAVGMVMFLLNKRRLKMGYVPELDEEDYA